MDTITRFIEHGFPFHHHLGIKVEQVAKESVRLRIPFKQELVGHVGKSILHGGVISTLIDICAGFAVWTQCDPKDLVTTITLSVDYLKPAPAEDLFAEARVRLLRNKVGNAHAVVWTASAPDVYVAEGRGVYNIKRDGPASAAG